MFEAWFDEFDLDAAFVTVHGEAFCSVMPPYHRGLLISGLE
jgi:hypothetical protein